MSEAATSGGGMTTPAQRVWHYAALPVLAPICLAPIWVMIATSLKDDVVVQSAEPLWFFFVPALDNYEYILTRRKFDRYLLNSAVVGVSATFLTLLFAGLAAYALARMDFRGRRFTANATLLVRMVPPAVLAVPAFGIVASWSLDSDLVVLIFFYTALDLPFAI